MSPDKESPFSPIEQIDIMYHEVESEFVSLGIFLNQIEKFIIQQRKIMDEYDFVIWSQNIMPHFKRSFILVLLSLFESKIEDICRDIAKIKNIPINREDLSGGFTTSLKKYLQTFGQFFKPNEDKWFILEGLYQVRNVFAHGGGEIYKANIGSMKKLRFLQSLNVGLSLKENFDLIWTHKQPPEKEVKPSESPPRPRILDENNLESNVYITADFCSYSIDFIFSFIEELKEEHILLVSGLRIIK